MVFLDLGATWTTTAARLQRSVYTRGIKIRPVSGSQLLAYRFTENKDNSFSKLSLGMSSVLEKSFR